jgi:transcriptional regulator with XRE-family HTH domain
MTRLSTLLEELAKKGVVQAQVAAAVGLTPQFLSDIKHGRRILSESIAHRLSERYQVDFEWLLGREADSLTGSMFGPPPGSALWLPLFPWPIQGEPQMHPDWDGSYFHIPAIAAPKLASALQPYILRYGNLDVDGRLRKGDLVLVSQSPNESAPIAVVREARKCFLARHKGQDWVRLANGKSLSADSVVVGHCLGVLWSALD